MFRKVVIKDTSSNSTIDIVTEAKTLGELKSELVETVDFNGKTTIVRETKQTLDLNGALLPEGAFHIFLYQKKSKFNSDSSERIAQLINDLTELKNKVDEGGDLGIDVNQLQNEMNLISRELGLDDEEDNEDDW